MKFLDGNNHFYKSFIKDVCSFLHITLLAIFRSFMAESTNVMKWLDVVIERYMILNI